MNRLKDELKETKRQHLIEDTFGGVMCMQNKCLNCGEIKNREEEYLDLSLNIKGVKTILESLRKQLQGEEVSDYFCEFCKSKVKL